MRPNLLAAGTDPAKVDKFDLSVKGQGDEAAAPVLAALSDLKGGPEYRAFVAIWTERPPDWWSNMALLGQTDGVEHRVLVRASTALKRAFARAAGAKAVPYAPADGPGAADGPEPEGSEHDPEEADVEARA